MSARLEDLRDCFQGVIPSIIATSSAAGEPNVTYLSEVYYVDSKHVALSCQFFNKTQRNVAENPYADVTLMDPVTFEAWRLVLKFDHFETSGPLFDNMAMRIQTIASHTGMSGVFRLISSDVYEVLEVVRVDGFLAPLDPVLDSGPKGIEGGGPLTELRGLQIVSERIARATSLDALLSGTLLTLDELFGFSHSMVLVPECDTGVLVTLASRGFDEASRGAREGERGIGARVAVGQGVIGMAASTRRMTRVTSMSADLRYGRAVRGRIAESQGRAGLEPEIPLPGLPDVQAQLALPLLAGDELVGVIAFESRDPLSFDEWDEAYLQIVANQIALGMARMESDADERDDEDAPAAPEPARKKTRTFTFYKNDDCVFVDGEYLVRNLPGKILWKLLKQRTGARTEYTNRELRLDPTLELPPIKDNLETRLILLKKHLIEKCPDVRIVPVKRGRFALELDCEAVLVEKDSA